MGGSRTVTRRAGAVLGAVSFLVLAGATAGFSGAAFAATYEGEPVAVGKGTARVVVRTDGSGAPESVAVKLSGHALDELPADLNKETSEGQWEFLLPMPADGPQTGYRNVSMDWNPQGHPPQEIYTVPHFDFHFYVMDAADVAQITFASAADPAIGVSDKGLIAPDYQVIPDTRVNQMGVHAIDMTSQEFQGKPFTATFIYGYYKGQLIFVEPMVTRAFLQSKPDAAFPVKTPAHYSTAGYYPESYDIRYDAGQDVYLVELGKLKHRQ